MAQAFPILPLAALMVIGLGAVGFAAGRARALVQTSPSGRERRARALPNQHAAYVVIWTVLPALGLLAVYALIAPVVLRSMILGAVDADVIGSGPVAREVFFRTVLQLGAEGPVAGTVTDAHHAAADRLAQLRALGAIGVAAVAAGLAGLGFWFARSRISPMFPARQRVELVIKAGLFVCSAVAIATTFGIVVSMLGESLRFFFQLPEDWWRIWTWETRVPLNEFLFGLKWAPQTALRADQVGQSGAFGAVPLFFGTLYITIIAMAVAAPLGLMSAIYLAEYASDAVRAFAKPMLEILAGVPTVVYGFFALTTIGPAIRTAAAALGLDAPVQSALSAGVVMGVMIIPFVSSLSDDVIAAVPKSLRDGALAMGATRSEMITQVVLPAALPGVMAALLLAVSRAVGETMIVVMAAGQAAKISANPLESLTTITVQIVTLLKGDQEFDSAKTLSAFALGLVLFIITLTLNIIALGVVKRYREKYD